MDREIKDKTIFAHNPNDSLFLQLAVVEGPGGPYLDKKNGIYRVPVIVEGYAINPTFPCRADSKGERKVLEKEIMRVGEVQFRRGLSLKPEEQFKVYLNRIWSHRTANEKYITIPPNVVSQVILYNP